MESPAIRKLFYWIVYVCRFQHHASVKRLSWKLWIILRLSQTWMTDIMWQSICAKLWNVKLSSKLSWKARHDQNRSFIKITRQFKFREPHSHFRKSEEQEIDGTFTNRCYILDTFRTRLPWQMRSQTMP